MDEQIVFGPVPSRRLGRSLGINNIPPKYCSYGCIYCQVGPTHDKTIALRPFFAPARLVATVAERVAAVRERGERIDYLTFVPDGEPTLDSNLAAAISALRPLGIPLVVISNASLLWREEVRSALTLADWVSLKVDSVEEAVWRRINRPSPQLELPRVLDGMRTFAAEFGGTLVTETMLVAGVNDSETGLVATSAFITTLQPHIAYLAAPTRPPAEHDCHAPDEAVLLRAYHQFTASLPRVEYLTGYEGDVFSASGDVASDILAISAVHPLRESALYALLQRTDAP